jgi:hypothetical protein
VIDAHLGKHGSVTTDPIDGQLRREELRKWLDRAPARDLGSALSELHAAQQLFQQECAQRLQLPLNSYVSQSDTHRSKVTIARLINSVCASLHLGVVCRNTGKVGVLVGTSGDNARNGRFLIRVGQGRRERFVTSSFTSLQAIQLAPRERGEVALPRADESPERAPAR